MQFNCYGVQFTKQGEARMIVSKAEARSMLQDSYATLATMIITSHTKNDMFVHKNMFTNTSTTFNKLSNGDWLVAEFYNEDEPVMLSFGFVAEAVAETTER